MSVAGENDSVPGTVFSPRQVRILKVAVIVMGVLLVGGFAFVLAAIVYQASYPAQVKGTTILHGQMQENVELSVPLGSTVTGLALDGNRLALQLHGSDGPEIIVVDLRSGKVAARIKLKPQ